MLDLIGSSNMIQGSLTNFTSDRFGYPNAALALNGGWTQVPSGVYFNTPEFTISTWLFPQNIGIASRISDFGVGTTNNIVFAISYVYSLKPYSNICSGSNCIIVLSSQTVTLNKWQFIALTFNGTNASIYLNGALVASLGYIYSLPTVTRTSCYIGKSNWAGDGYSFSFLDDLRFYNKSLSQTEILELMNSNETSK